MGLNLNRYHCIRKTILNGDDLLDSFEDKSLLLRYFLIEGKLSVLFLILSYKHKQFYDFSTSKLLANFHVFDRFRKNLNYKQKFIRNLVLNFQVFLIIQNFFTDTSKKISHKNRKFQWSIYNSKKGAEVKNRSIFTALNVVDRHKKKTHIIIKSIHSSLRSESKIMTMPCVEDSDLYATMTMTHIGKVTAPIIIVINDVTHDNIAHSNPGPNLQQQPQGHLVSTKHSREQ
ncbi:hypothetical protein AGLY_015513 [Aphis glycines]|uniref:Uncharacterized protein n=1 Tax=Aphis glycines TaxID=307491 RepID=A0A6G0T169_APHGL|nr:hypothetical protein AGLY_015513 [Aphis glycines]